MMIVKNWSKHHSHVYLVNVLLNMHCMKIHLEIIKNKQYFPALQNHHMIARTTMSYSSTSSHTRFRSTCASLDGGEYWGWCRPIFVREIWPAVGMAWPTALLRKCCKKCGKTSSKFLGFLPNTLTHTLIYWWAEPQFVSWMVSWQVHRGIKRLSGDAM